MTFSAGGEDRDGFAQDISMSGMFIATLEPLPFASTVAITLRLPGQDENIVLPATVRWVREAEGMGVQFGLLGAQQTHCLGYFLEVHFRNVEPATIPKRTA